MMHRIAVGTSLTLLLLAGSVYAAETVKSGPQIGEKIPGPFTPLNVTGDEAGQKRCLVCKNGLNPVAMVFAREVSEPLTSLLKKLDAATAKHSSCNMGSFVVFCSDDESLQARLKDLAKKEKIEHLVLSIDNPAGPSKYKVAQDAAVTVVLYTNHDVKANYAFRKGELKAADVDKIVADVTKILPAK